MKKCFLLHTVVTTLNVEIEAITSTVHMVIIIRIDGLGNCIHFNIVITK